MSLRYISTFLLTFVQHIECFMQAFLPQLGADKSLQGPPGRIINISSISGKYSAPFVGAYCASKHALEGMSDSLRRELMLFGIDVIVIGALLELSVRAILLRCRLVSLLVAARSMTASKAHPKAISL